MEALIALGVLAAALCGVGAMLRRQGLPGVGVGFVGAAVLVVLVAGVRAATTDLGALNSALPDLERPSEPDDDAPTPAQIAETQHLCMEGRPSGVSSVAHLCRCTAEAWAAGRQHDPDFQLVVMTHTVELRGGNRAARAAFEESFSRCGASSAREWVTARCESAEGSGLSGFQSHAYCDCVARRVAEADPERAAAAFWIESRAYANATNACLRAQ